MVKLRILLVCAFLFAAYVASAFANPFPAKQKSSLGEIKYGVSWSFENAAWYGLDPRADYVKLLDSTKFDWVRLVFYWDQMADKNGELKIDDLKFAIREADKRNIDIVIALGAKTPFYPEYHLPSYVRSQIKFGDTIGFDHPIADDLLDIDKKLVGELSIFDNIAYWQIENEPYLANIENIKIDSSLINAEAEVVRNADTKRRPIILNHVGPASVDKKYRKLLEILKPGDILGVNAYFKTQGVNLIAFKFLGGEIRIGWPKWLVWPVQSWTLLSPDYGRLKDEVEKKGVKLWILEMQADPYIRSLTDANRETYSFSSGDIARAASYLNSYGVESIGLWGAPFWMYREKNADPSWIKSIQNLK